MTHEYTLLVGGLVLSGAESEPVQAIAWAASAILAIGSDAEVRAISRGDSRVVDLRGAVVIPLDGSGAATWPTAARLEVGGEADLAIIDVDPRASGRAAGPLQPTATVRGGRLISGAFPGPPSESMAEAP